MVPADMLFDTVTVPMMFCTPFELLPMLTVSELLLSTLRVMPYGRSRTLTVLLPDPGMMSLVRAVSADHKPTYWGTVVLLTNTSTKFGLPGTLWSVIVLPAELSPLTSIEPV